MPIARDWLAYDLGASLSVTVAAAVSRARNERGCGQLGLSIGPHLSEWGGNLPQW